MGVVLGKIWSWGTTIVRLTQMVTGHGYKRDLENGRILVAADLIGMASVNLISTHLHPVAAKFRADNADLGQPHDDITQLLLNRTFAHGYQSNHEAMHFLDYMSSAGDLTTSISTTSANSANNSTIKTAIESNSTDELKPYLLLAANAPGGIHFSGVVDYKEKLNGSEPVYMMSCGNSTAEADTHACIATHLQMLAHHSTTLVPGMLERVGAERFREAMHSVIMQLYDEGKVEEGVAQKRDVADVAACRDVLQRFREGMMQWEPARVR